MAEQKHVNGKSFEKRWAYSMRKGRFGLLVAENSKDARKYLGSAAKSKMVWVEVGLCSACIFDRDLLRLVVDHAHESGERFIVREDIHETLDDAPDGRQRDSTRGLTSDT